MLVSPSSLRNYALNNCLLDWLVKYGGFGGFDTYVSHLMRQGDMFESMIMEQISKKVGNKNILSFPAKEKPNKESFAKTVEAMNKNIPLIYNGTLYDEEKGIYGKPDLIVRVDYIQNIVEFPPDDICTDDMQKFFDLLEENPSLRKKNIPNRYTIVDIKYTTIPIPACGFGILNSSSFPAYKVQLRCYAMMLEKHGFGNSNRAFILGKGYKHATKNIQNPFERLGEINYAKFDSVYVERTENAIAWYKRLLTEGKEWDPINNLKECPKELYPNLSIDDSYEITKKKMEIARNNKFVSYFYQCNNSEPHFGWKKEHLSNTIAKKQLQLLRSKEAIMSPDRLEDMFDPDKPTLYIDIESVNDSIDCKRQIPTMTYMIGTLYTFTDGDAPETFNIFTAKDLTTKEEDKMVNRFKTYLKTLPRSLQIVFYSSVERLFLEGNEIVEYEYTYHDLYNILKNNEIVFSDCRGYALKDIIRSLNMSGLTQLSYSEEECGKNTSILVYNWKYDNNKDNIVKTLENYNKKDLVAMKEIARVLTE